MFLGFSKLKGSVNYYSWKVKMKHPFKKEWVWEVVVPLNVIGQQLSSLRNGVSSPLIVPTTTVVVQPTSIAR
jgi:hypothetical protein